MNVVVTGSSTGIGRALVEHLLGKGHAVWGLARSDQVDFAAKHPTFRFSRCDVSDYAAVSRATAEIMAAWAHVDALVCAAGLQGEIGPALSADPVKWSATVRANLDGTYFVIRALAPVLAGAPRRQKIVCFSGGGATKSRANFSAYGVAKTGIVRLVETIADETRGQPLDINALAPGAINTRLTEEVLALGPEVVGAGEYAAAQKQKATGGGSLEKALGCVEWLISPASDGISGRLIAAPWDPWSTLGQHREALASSDIYMLRRIVPEERGTKL
jgi:NAD(P)-dependent dehydrogenase (short-subunit alcohol dehydrogenase family)